MEKLFKYLIIVSIISTSLLMQTELKAQQKVGIKGGLNLSNLTGDTNDKNLLAGFHVGGWLEAPVTEALSIQPELLFSQKGLKQDYNWDELNVETRLRLNYLEIPVNLVYHLSKDFSFEGGPYIGYLLSAKMEATSENNSGSIEYLKELDRNDFNQFDFGLGFGLRYYFNPLYLGFNYKAGFANITNNEKTNTDDLFDKAKNNVIQIYAGIAF